MDKNILEKYQKRVKEILETLGKYQVIITEGIEASQERTDARLAELQARREELEQPIDMSDVSITMIDRRTPARSEYNDDREGFLLSEYDKRRLDGYSGPKYAEIVNEIRVIREAKRLEQKELVEEEMQSLIEEQLNIDNVRFTEAEKASLIMLLQDEKIKIESNIQRKKSTLTKKISEFYKATEEGDVHKQALTLYKDPNSKVYTAAKAELGECIRKAELAQRRVKRLVREISNLEQDLTQVDKLLDSLSDSREMDEISKQEDEMWEAYRAEQNAEKARQEENKEREIDEAIRHKQEIEKGQEIRDDRDAVDAVSQGYADGLNQEEELIKPETHEKPVKSQTTTEPKSQEPAKPQQTTGSKNQGPDRQQTTTEPKPQPNPKPEKWKVESVVFTVEGGIQPVYKAIVSNGKETREFTSTEIAVLDTEFERDAIKTLTERKGINKAENCYDKGLAILLEQIDGECGTQSLKDYQTLLADREMIHKYPERYENCMKINYDFSGLLVRPSEAMTKLQKMAKANQTKGVVSEFKGRPNFLTRLIKRIFTKSLPKEARIKMPRVQTSKKALDELEAQMAANVQDITELRVMKDWSDMHIEPGFDIEVFIKQNFEEAEWISEEANRFRVLQDEYEEGLEKDPQAAFRKRIQEEAENEAPPIRRKEEDELIVVDSENIKVLDSDGMEI